MLCASFQVSCSFSAFPQTITASAPPNTDLNADGHINILDLLDALLFYNQVNHATNILGSDLNDLFDFNYLIAHLGS